jgi:tetratricopeptide (TPR) repeat protein
MNLKIARQGCLVALFSSALCVSASAAPVLPETTEQSPSSFAGGFELRLKAIDAYRVGAYVESATLFKQALGALSDPEGLGAIVLWNELGAAAMADGKASDAEEDCLTSARLNEKRSAANLRELAISYRSLAVIAEKRGQLKRAEELYTQAEKVADKGGLLGSPEGAAILRGEAICLLKQERYDEAQPVLIRTLDILRRKDGQSPDYGKSLSSYSLLELQTGHYQEAVTAAREALAMLLGSSGEESTTMATLNNLGVALTNKGRAAEAEVEFLRAVDIGRKNPQALAVPLAEALNNLAAAEKLNGQLAVARDHDLEALGLTERGFEDTAALQGTILNNLGLIALAQKDLAKAEAYCSKAGEEWAKWGGRNNSKYAAALSNLAAIERARRQYRKAYEMELKALSINETILGPDHPAVALNLANLGVDLFCLKRFDDAMATLEQAERIQEKRLGEESVATAYTLHNMAAMLAQLKRYGDASETYDRAIRARIAAVPDPYDATLGQWVREDAAVLRKAGRFGEAEMAEVRAMKIEVKNAIGATASETTAERKPAISPPPGNGFQERTPDAPPL